MTRRQFAVLASAAMASACDGLARAALDAPGDPVQRWRADFPALRETVNGHPIAYLDSAATTERPWRVIDAITQFYRRDNANPGRTLHARARRAAELYEQARRSVAAFVNAFDANEIVWVRGTTEAINLAAAAWFVPRAQPGDEILLTITEHYSNLLPWREAAARTGAVIRTIDVDDEGRLRLADLDRQLSPRTKLVAVTHVSNVLGLVNPVTEICARARRVGARVLVDAAQSIPHLPVDVRALGCDFLAFSSHKMLGPMGVGVLWAKRERLDEMAPYQTGSNMAHDVDGDSAQYEHGALKFGAGTPNVSGPIGLAAAAAYLDGLGRDAIRDHEQAVTRYALERLAAIRGVRLIGPRDAADRLPVFAFTVDGATPADIVRALDGEGIAVRAGDMAALPLLQRFGVRAAARASCYLYTTRGEIDRLADALERISAARG